MAIVPKTKSESEPINEIVKVTQPVGTKNVVGTQINPATEDTSATILAKFVPLAKASQHNVAVDVNVDILAADLSPTNTPCLFRTMVVLETAGVFSAQLKNGGVTVVGSFNGGIALVANCAYIFDILVHSGDTVNFQTSASGNVTLRVQEIVAGVQ